MKTRLCVLAAACVAVLGAGAKSAKVAQVFDYRPAPGQFVNTLPAWEKGETQADMNAKVLAALQGNNMITLGAYGGYVIFGFDHPVVNVPDEFDLKISGNAYANGSEAGIVMVGVDRDGDGVPSEADDWYELAGAAYEGSFHDYEIYYSRPKDELTSSYPWVSNDREDGEGEVERNGFHKQEYWPQWIEADEMTFTGTRLPRNAYNDGMWKLPAYGWGYVDDVPDTDNPGLMIDWAVDAKGNHVDLPYIDFVKVYTGINQCAGWLGETSTEVAGATDLHVDATIDNGEEVIVPYVDPTIKKFDHGFFIVNEGAFGKSPGSIHFVTADGRWLPLADQEAHRGSMMGETLQFMTIYGEKYFAACKELGKWTGAAVFHAGIADNLADFYVEQSTFMTDDSEIHIPHAIMGVNENKVYLGTSNGIFVFDPSENMMFSDAIVAGSEAGFKDDDVMKGAYIDYPANQYAGQIGSMVKKDGYVLAVHQDKGILVIDPETDEVIDVIKGTYGDIAKTPDGRVWVSNAAPEAWDMVTTAEVATLTELVDLKGTSKDIAIPSHIAAPAVSWASWHCSSLMTRLGDNRLYWTDKEGYDASNSYTPSQHVYYYDTESGKFGTFADFDKLGLSGYSMYSGSKGFSPANGHFYAVVNGNTDGNYGTTKYYLIELDEEGELVSIVQFPVDGMWFSGQIVFTDDVAPELNLPTSVELAKGESVSFALSEIVRDADSSPADFNVQVTSVKAKSDVARRAAAETVVESSVADDQLTITRTGRGDVTLTVNAESNGRVTTGELIVVDSTPVPTAISDIEGRDAVVVEQAYYDAAGRRLAAPQQGVNIVVTRYDDGRVMTTKVMR